MSIGRTIKFIICILIPILAVVAGGASTASTYGGDGLGAIVLIALCYGAYRFAKSAWFDVPKKYR